MKKIVCAMLLLAAILVGGALKSAEYRFLRYAHAADGDTAKAPGAVDSAYDPDRQTAAYRSTLSANDSTFTKTAILALPKFNVGNRTTITVGARFSNASQTCQVQIVYIYKSGDPNGSDTNATTNTIKGWSQVVTLTGGSVQKEGAYYEAPDYPFDSGRAVTIRVMLITKPSAGSVDLWVGS